jgi:DNA-binding transcriptional LysR family regulator
MVRKIDWDSQIGRRLKLRDLHVFSTVIQQGSMAKAAQQLGVSQPAVSEVIANLEHALGVRLVDRSAQGIEPTIYGDCLLRRSVAVFDELKQGIKDIEFLSDATTGEVRIACMESLWFTFLPEIILRFSKLYPHVKMHADLTAHLKEFSGLRERKYDCMLERVPASIVDHHGTDDLNVESLFDEVVGAVAGTHTKWARRRKIDLAELINEPWASGGPGTWHRALIEEIFHARGLSAPEPSVATVSISLRARLVAAGPYLGFFLPSVVRQLIADHHAITTLPVDLPAIPFRASIVTLKNRTLSPVVERFIACAREVAASFGGKQGGRSARPPHRTSTSTPR